MAAYDRSLSIAANTSCVRTALPLSTTVGTIIDGSRFRMIRNQFFASNKF